LTKQIRNIAIFAHVDAGKTSVTEQLLYHSGTIRTLGSVANGNTQTDTLEVEKQRGITVNSSILSFEWNDCKINLIDTPGHIDFSSETQKAFLAIDCAILVISAVEGIQAQTENLINLLLDNKKPFLIFINKIDRMGSNIAEIISELNSDLNLATFSLQTIQNEASNEVGIQLNWEDNSVLSNSSIEKIVEHNENLLADYFDGKNIPFETLNKELIALTQQQKIIPLFIGSAKFDLGIKNLLNGIESYLPQPKSSTNDLFGIVFKTFHKKDGKWLAVRLFDGEIETRTSIVNASQNSIEKVSMIKSIDLNNSKIIAAFQAGDIALIKGLSQAKPGDFIGKTPKNTTQSRLAKPLLSVQIIPNNNAEINKLVDALLLLNNEDPELNFNFIKEEREFHIKIHGEIQKEI